MKRISISKAYRSQKYRAQKKMVLCILILVSVITLAKLLFLERTPLFGDEALYCYLGHKLAYEPFFQALGTTVNYWKDAPGLPLLNAISFKLIGQSNMFLTCRLLPILTSGLASIVLYLFLRQLTIEKKIAIFALLLLLLNPYSFFFDRTSLMDVPLVAFSLLYLYSGMRFLNTGKWVWLLGTGSFGMLMFLTKFNALLIAPVIWFLIEEGQSRYLKRLVLGVVTIISITVILTYIYTNVWETVFYHVDTTTSIFVIGDRFFENWRMVIGWFKQFLTPAGVIFSIWGGMILYKKGFKRLVWIVPLIISIYAVSARNLFPRYFLILLPFWSVLVAAIVTNKWGRIALATLFILFVVSDYLILTQPHKATLAEQTRYEYFADWGSGRGTQTTYEYFIKQPDKIPERLLVPTDLEGLFFIYKLALLPQSPLKLSFFNQTSLPFILAALDTGKTYIAVTPYHEWAIQYLEQRNYSQMYTSHGAARYSIWLYEVK